MMLLWRWKKVQNWKSAMNPTACSPILKNVLKPPPLAQVVSYKSACPVPPHFPPATVLRFPSAFKLEGSWFSVTVLQSVTQHHVVVTRFWAVQADVRKKAHFSLLKKSTSRNPGEQCVLLWETNLYPFSQSGRDSKQRKSPCWRRGYFDLCHLQSVRISSHTLSSQTEITMSTQGFVRA